MDNLRIIDIKIIDSTNITVKFSNNLTTNLITSNIEIKSETSNVPSSDVLKVKVKNDLLYIDCQPLSPLATYMIVLKSTALNPFQSVNGTSKVLEDNVSNKYMITGPLSTDNTVRKYFESYFNNNIYKLEDNTIISKYIDALSINFSKILYDIKQVKNENYLSFSIIDEQKVRGAGPFDRLDEESAYQITRVGRTPTGTVSNLKLNINTFPSFPITLQKESVKESLTVSSLNETGKFNINDLILNLTYLPVTKVNKITFTLNSINSIYEYDIVTLGYQIKNSRYDKDYSFDYLLLNENQIKINESILNDSDFLLNSIIKVDVEYEYKNLGRVINPDSVKIFTTLNSNRETLPSITNIFNLKHAPIVNSNNVVYTISGVTFIDPNSNTNSAHPAFKNEIQYRMENLPSLPGQYSIDYSTGTVYVYGADLNNDGTGAYPPLATYTYELVYKSQIDYVYDEDLLDIVALPNGSLIDSSGVLECLYEQVLVPNVDYVANLHKEELSERIANKLVALNTLKTQFAPITNVFRIYNETSGEIYSIDRWNHDKVYFRYNNPPKIISKTNERVTFDTVSNELLFVNSSLINSSSLKIFKILLNNNSIVSSTEDSIASSFNTSLTLSNSNIFVIERWANKEFAELDLINNLINIGEFTVDYSNGIVYVAVSTIQNFDIGTVTYKYNNVITNNSHIISLEDIYYRISVLNPKNKIFKYIIFDDTGAIVSGLENSDESYLNNDKSLIYQTYQNVVGTFSDSNFINGISNQIKSIKGIFEYSDLLSNKFPINFGNVSTFSDFDITLNSINKEVFENINYDGSYYINLDENLSFISDNISYSFSVIRVSDSAQLWNGSGVLDISSDTLKLILPGINSPQNGELVQVIYSFSINDLSRVVIDYNKGDLFIDYTYLADEIIVSYEYGDNVIDYRSSKTVSANDNYYVSYKAGSLRDSLLKNFGSLVNIDELSTFDINFDRERYRDALSAALSSFIQGPTLSAIKSIGKTISHIEPEITESIFQNWSLGNSILVPQDIISEGEFELLPAKFGNGVLLNSNEQVLKLPVNSNIRLEEGTFETWLLPQWNGFDNDADITFAILKDGYPIEESKVFIGAGEYHPTIASNKFSLNKNSENIFGVPNKNKDGVFIYYNEDSLNDYNKWYIDVVDGYIDGYTDGYNSSYKITIETNGKFYDSKTDNSYYTKLTTTNNKLIANISGAFQLDERITFFADLEHFLFDFGETSKNRLSLYKDVNGCVTFRTIDNKKNIYSISHDISDWKLNQQHHVAISWKLNTINNKDEMHLFIDGLEVPNVLSHENRNSPFDDRFKNTTNLDIIGTSLKDIVGSNDLITTYNSATVKSSINFSSFNINIGDVIYIDETGFDSNGYVINNINGQDLILNSVMPFSITGGNYSVNRQSFVLNIPINLYSNIAVSKIEEVLSGSDLIANGTNIVTSASTNFTTNAIEDGYFININSNTYSILEVNNYSLTLSDIISSGTGINYKLYSDTETELSGVRALRPDYSIEDNILTISNNSYENNLIVLKTLGLNFNKVKNRYYVWSDNTENVLMTRMPPPINLDEVEITKVILPLTSINSSNSTVLLNVFQSNNILTSQPSISVEGRQLNVILSGLNNTDFGTSVEVTIYGTVGIVNTFETLYFSDYIDKPTLNNFNQINYITVKATAINASKSVLNIEIKELYPITHADGYSDGYNDGYTVPVIRYSYHMGGGYTLKKDTDNSIRDPNNNFSHLHIGNHIRIYTTVAAGYYLITGISDDRKSLTIEPSNSSVVLPLPSFIDATYQILNTTQNRSGLQNGYFTFEQASSPGEPYYLNSGFYELVYNTYASIKFDPINSYAFIGNNIDNSKTANVVLDQIKIYSTMLSDTRIGETVSSNQNSITKDFNSLKELKADSNTLMLLNFNSFPFVNTAKIYNNVKDKSIKNHFQSSIVVNENFNSASLAILNNPLIIDNDGILDTKKAGTIEFWMSPLYDTFNDPNTRYYFDAYGAVTEELVSYDNTSVKMNSSASSILSVKLKTNNSIDYFSGGQLEISTENVIQEVGVSVNSNTITTSKQILQVVSVKIEDDFRSIDYFANGSIGTDLKTIYLGKTLPQNNVSLIVTYKTFELSKTQNSQIIRLNRKLPYQNTPVLVTYIPKGLVGNRLSIFKDSFGYLNFSINEFVIRAPIYWSKDSWHRIKASYKLNGSSGTNNDEMRLFLDGYEFKNLTFNENVFSPLPYVFGSSSPGDGYNYINSIVFKDSINSIYIGSQFNEQNPAFTLIDNFRISNISRQIFAPYGESIDVNYSSNLNTVFPVTEDLYTTYLLDFNKLIKLTDDFAIIKNRSTGLFDFSINILDSLGIINNNTKVKEVLEKLIKVLKPATSKAYITYT